MPRPAPGESRRASGPAATPAAAADATHQVATAAADASEPAAAPPARDTPSASSPAIDQITPALSRRDSGVPAARTSSARTPMPPADVACTSESGASASAAT